MGALAPAPGKRIPERKRRKFKGRTSLPFIAIPREVLDSSEFGDLSPQATKLLMELSRQFRGNNNGDFSAAWKPLSERGWNSPGTLNRAKKELTETGFALVSRQGGKNRCSLYAMTWWAIDECNGKLDVAPTHAPLNLWKKTKPVVHIGTNLDHSSTNHRTLADAADSTGPSRYLPGQLSGVG
ncbi:hypothetical protein GCM10027431_07970 [Lysobacter rhizosphaerae]